MKKMNAEHDERIPKLLRDLVDMAVLWKQVKEGGAAFPYNAMQHAVLLNEMSNQILKKYTNIEELNGKKAQKPE